MCVLPRCCWRLTQWCRSHWGCCWSCYSGSLGLSQGRCYTQSLNHKHAQIKYIQGNTAALTQKCFWTADSCVSVHPSPAMSSERFLAVVMGLSRRRSSGLLLRSLTFCFSLERSFRLGSEAERRMDGEMIHSFMVSMKSCSILCAGARNWLCRFTVCLQVSAS